MLNAAYAMSMCSETNSQDSQSNLNNNNLSGLDLENIFINPNLLNI